MRSRLRRSASPIGPRAALRRSRLKLKFFGQAAVNYRAMTILLSTLLGLTLLSPWIGQECRPGFDERSKDARFGVLR